MQQESFEELLNRKTGGFTLTPREGLWESIERELVPEKKKRSLAVYFLLAGILLSGTAAYLGLSNTDVKKQAVLQNLSPSKNEIASQMKLPVERPIHSERMEASTNSSKVSNQPLFNKGVYSPVHALGNQYSDSKRTFANQQNKLENVSVVLKESSEKGEDIQSAQIKEKQQLTVAEVEVTFNADSSLIAINIPLKNDSVKTDLVTIPKPSNVKFYVGLMAMSLKSYAQLSLSNPVDQATTDYNDRKNTDRGNMGFVAGISGGLEKGRHLFHTGLQFRQMGYQMLLKNIVRKPSSGVGTGIAANRFSFSPDSFQLTKVSDGGTFYTTKLNFISIPLGYTFNLINGRVFKAGLNGNLIYNRLVSSNALVYDEQGGYYIKKQLSENLGLVKNNWSLSAGLDMSYRVGPGLSITLQPQYGFTLNPVEKAAIVTHLKYWGISAGLKWYLK